MKSFRERNNLPPSSPIDSESEKGFSDCIADMKCIEFFVNIFFYISVSLLIYMVLTNAYTFITSLF